MTKKILLLSGDPNSINSEIIYKSWKKLDTSLKKQIYLVGNAKLLRAQFKKLGYHLKMIKVNPDQQPRLLSNARRMMLTAKRPEFKQYWEKVYLYLLKRFNRFN